LLIAGSVDHNSRESCTVKGGSTQRPQYTPLPKRRQAQYDRRHASGRGSALVAILVKAKAWQLNKPFLPLLIVVAGDVGDAVAFLQPAAEVDQTTAITAKRHRRGRFQ